MSKELAKITPIETMTVERHIPEFCQTSHKHCPNKPRWFAIDGKAYCGWCVKTQGHTRFCDEIERLDKVQEACRIGLIKLRAQALGERMKHAVPLDGLVTVEGSLSGQLVRSDNDA